MNPKEYLDIMKLFDKLYQYQSKNNLSPMAILNTKIIKSLLSSFSYIMHLTLHKYILYTKRIHYSNIYYVLSICDSNIYYVLIIYYSNIYNIDICFNMVEKNKHLHSRRKIVVNILRFSHIYFLVQLCFWEFLQLPEQILERSVLVKCSFFTFVGINPFFSEILTLS